MEKYITYSEEVKNALEKNLPIVALESTIISHGMPYPKNLETAKKCEEVIRQNGCLPATIAILNGKLKVGLNEDELEYLAKANDVIKASRRDVPYSAGAMSVMHHVLSPLSKGLFNRAVMCSGGGVSKMLSVPKPEKRY